MPNLHHEAPSATIYLMPSLFNQTIQLLLEARQYFESEGKELESSLSGWHKHQYASEMARITMRLSCIMAWLSVQKAVCAGQISHDEARDQYPLDGQSTCLGSDVAAESVLPPSMNYLLEESRSLYERIHRLEQQFNAANLH